MLSRLHKVKSIDKYFNFVKLDNNKKLFERIDDILIMEYPS